MSSNSIDQGIEGSDEGDGQVASSPYLWLLIIDLLIFASLTLTTYTSSKKLNVSQHESTDFRPKFIKALVLANGVRTLSLIFIIILGNPNGNNPTSWLNSLLHVFPSFIFVSSYMYLSTFLADMYYTNIDYNNHIMKPALLISVVSGYILLAVIALITFIVQSFKVFNNISEFLMAMLYLILGGITVYYGQKVTTVLALQNHNRFDGNSEMYSKLCIISYSLGGLFLLKGLSGLLQAISIVNTTTYPNIYDFFWFLILEISPTVIFIVIARRKDTVIDETPRASFEMEMDSSREYSSAFRDTQGGGSYRPPFAR